MHVCVCVCVCVRARARVHARTRTHTQKEGKAIPVTGHGGPQGCEMLRLPHFLDNWLTDGGEVVSLMHQLPFTPGRFLVLIC
jgi:hypothetical protein